MYSINTRELERREIPTTLTTLYLPCKVGYINTYSLPNWEHEFVSEQFKDMDNDPYIDISSAG